MKYRIQASELLSRIIPIAHLSTIIHASRIISGQSMDCRPLTSASYRRSAVTSNGLTPKQPQHESNYRGLAPFPVLFPPRKDTAIGLGGSGRPNSGLTLTWPDSRAGPALMVVLTSTSISDTIKTPRETVGTPQLPSTALDLERLRSSCMASTTVSIFNTRINQYISANEQPTTASGTLILTPYANERLNQSRYCTHYAHIVLPNQPEVITGPFGVPECVETSEPILRTTFSANTTI